MSSSLGVVLDANVLIPMALCDTLLRAAHERLFRLHWSQEILDEVQRNLVKNKLASTASAERRVHTMRAAFPESLVSGYEALVPVMTNHPKDRHVTATAVRINAQIIVTCNVKHFPGKALKRYDIEAQTPDNFLSGLYDLNPDTMKEIIRAQASALRNPPSSVAQVLAKLSEIAPAFADIMVQAMRPHTATQKNDVMQLSKAARKAHAN